MGQGYLVEHSLENDISPSLSEKKFAVILHGSHFAIPGEVLVSAVKSPQGTWMMAGASPIQVKNDQADKSGCDHDPKSYAQ
jgi:hypothetical protein